MTSGTLERTERGTFARTREPWTPERWDDGYVDNRGRFRVYRPDCPRAYEGGYALRAHVVYWLQTGDAHPPGTDLHHVSEDKHDDRFENLEVKEHAAHTRHHHAEAHEFVCENCEQPFAASGDTVSKRRAEGKQPRFCSQRCYHAYPKSDETRAAHSAGLRRAYQEGRR